VSRRRYRSRNSSGGGFAALLGVLLIVGLIIKFIWWIVGAAAIVGAFYVIRAVVRENRRQQAATAQRCAEVAARADQQHDWVMSGDDRGIYGPECAPLMRFIERGGPPAPTTGPPVIPPRAGPFGTRFVR
jgi:hypothetical protein